MRDNGNVSVEIDGIQFDMHYSLSNMPVLAALNRYELTYKGWAITLVSVNSLDGISELGKVLKLFKHGVGKQLSGYKEKQGE